MPTPDILLLCTKLNGTLKVAACSDSQVELSPLHISSERNQVGYHHSKALWPKPGACNQFNWDEVSQYLLPRISKVMF